MLFDSLGNNFNEVSSFPSLRWNVGVFNGVLKMNTKGAHCFIN